MAIDANLVITLLGVVGSGGVAVGVTRMKLSKIDKLERSFEQHAQKDDRHQLETIDRLARQETKMDSAHARLKSIDTKIDKLIERG